MDLEDQNNLNNTNMTSWTDLNGSYLIDSNVVKPEIYQSWARDPIDAERLWQLSEKLVDQKFDYSAAEWWMMEAWRCRDWCVVPANYYQVEAEKKGLLYWYNLP